jgi:formyltetrahydrofolate-dependent phosphoribosylglycinamide formyltransferase
MTRLRVGVLASGSGTTFENLVERSRDGRLDAEIAGLAVSRPDCGAVARAARLGVPCTVLPKERMRDPAGLGEAIGAFLDGHAAGLCVMAGFLKLWTLPPHWRGRVMNVHPALLPAFGGHGMYGHHVHEAVVASGAKVSGCTVHFADDQYDQGPIVLQRVVPVSFEDTPDDVATRVQAAEREAYPEAVALFAAGRLRVEGRRVRVLP